jgi:hypothetical protein
VGRQQMATCSILSILKSQHSRNFPWNVRRDSCPILPCCSLLRLPNGSKHLAALASCEEVRTSAAKRVERCWERERELSQRNNAVNYSAYICPANGTAFNWHRKLFMSWPVKCSSKISKNILDHFPANGTFVDLGVFQ